MLFVTSDMARPCDAFVMRQRLSNGTCFTNELLMGAGCVEK
jgi:hypothetical protein